MSISPNGELLAVGASGDSLRVLDRQALTTRQRGDGIFGTISSIEFSPDSSVLAVAVKANRTPLMIAHVELIDAASGRRIGTLAHDSLVDVVRFDSVGRLLTGSEQGTVCIWDINDQKLLHKFFGAPHRINDIAVSAGNMYLACEDNCVRVYSMQSLPSDEHVREVPHGFDIAFSPDSRQVASGGSDGKLRIIDTASGKLASISKQAYPYIWSSAYSPDGKTIASVATPYPARDECLLLLHNDQGDELHRFEIPQVRWGRCLRFLPGSNVVVVGADGNLIFWDAKRTQVTRKLTIGGGEGHVFAVDVSQDGRVIGCVVNNQDPGIHVWEYPSLTPLVDRAFPAVPGVWGFALSSTGQCYAAADEVEDRHSISVYTIANQRRSLSLSGHTDSVVSIDFSPDDRRLVSTGKDGLVILWDLETGREITRFREHSNWVWQVRFSPDGELLASVEDSSRDHAVVIRRAMSLNAATQLIQSATSKHRDIDGTETLMH
ncbi:MAG: hypothetical protein R3C28_07105 [Pirellulaceae bacterium]